MYRFLFILLLFSFLEIRNGLAQCEIMDTLINIPDNEKPLGIKLVVEGVVNDDLSDPDQGVCRVYLRYEHQRRTELTIDLISPSGQVVRLVGPYNPLAFPNPGNRKWNINFFPCANAVAPDPGKSDHFDNNDNWGLFVEFNGSYYPHDLCLEQFDSGPVNGTWTFLVHDHEEIYSGLIRGYAIEFCDGSVFDCNPCAPQSGNFTIDSLEFCVNEPFINIDSYHQFSDSIVDSLYYRYNYLLGMEGQLYKITDSLDIDGFEPGVYDIYGISYHINDSTALFNLLDSIDFDHFVDSLRLEEAPYCSRMTPDPLVVTIHPVETEFLIPISLCEGEYYIFRDDTIINEGLYFFKSISNTCDTTYIIDVSVLQLDPGISASSTELTCHNNAITLRGEGYTDGVGMRFEWIEFPDSSQLELTVTQPGTYHFVLIDGHCSDTASITIKAADDIPLLDYNVQAIDCCNPEGTISVSVENVPVASYEWSFDGSVLPENTGQLTSNIPGNYTLTAISDLGCSVQVNIFLPIDTISPDVDFYYNDITCTNPFSEIILSSVSELTGINWIGLGETTDTLIVSEAGTYFVEITSSNCCSSVDSVVISSFTEPPEITLTSGADMDCLIRSVELSFSSGSEITDFYWTTPENVQLYDNPVLVTTPGMYYLRVENEYGCETVDSVFISEDTDPPDILFESDPFVITCDVDSIQLGFSSSSAIAEISWLGPDGFSSSELNPFVRYEGIYYLWITGENHCIANKAVEVILDIAAPQLEGVLADTLDCLRQDINVKAVYSGNYSFRWLIPDGTELTGPEIVSPNAGVFYLTVTDQDNNCSSQFFIESPVDTIPVDFTLISDNLLDCNHDYVDIYLNSYDRIRSLQWYNDTGTFNSFSDTARTFMPGTYFVEATGKNYCVSADSINVKEGDYIFISNDTFYLSCTYPVVELSVPGAMDDYIFSWTGPDGFISDSARPEADKGGNYYVDISSGECLESTVILVIENKDLPDIDISYDSVIGCDPDYARLNGIINESDYLSFEWTGPGLINDTDLYIEVTDPGTYLFSVTGNNGCADTLYANIIVSQENPEFNAVGNSISCDIPVVLIRAIDVEQHESFYWEGPENFYSALIEPEVDLPGSYKLVVTGHNQCRDSITIYVTADTIKPHFVIAVTDSLNCENNKTVLMIDSLSPDRQYSYEWNTDSGIIEQGAVTSQASVTGAGVYRIIVSDKINGCVTEDSVELDFIAYDLDSLSITVRHPDCFGSASGFIRIDEVHGGEGPYRFSTDNLNFSNINTFSERNAGSLRIYVKDRYACSIDTVVVLNEGAIIDVHLESDKNDVFPGTKVTIYPDVSSPNGIGFAKWSPERYFLGKNDAIPVEIEPSESVFVTLEVSDSLGCIGQGSIWIMIKTQPEIKIPNIFTPDGDGINDHFYISVKNGVKSISDFKIFNRWGELLYSINNPGLNEPSDGWDGRYRGRMAPQGVYVVFFSVELDNGGVESFYSDFTLIR